MTGAEGRGRGRAARDEGGRGRVVGTSRGEGVEGNVGCGYGWTGRRRRGFRKSVVYGRLLVLFWFLEEVFN